MQGITTNQFLGFELVFVVWAALIYWALLRIGDILKAKNKMHDDS